MLRTRLWRCSPALPVFVIARWEGRRANLPTTGEQARLPSRRFLVVPLCAARRVAVFPSAHLVFEFLFACVSFLLARVLCYLRLFCSCLRYFVVVDDSLCPLIAICFVS